MMQACSGIRNETPFAVEHPSTMPCQFLTTRGDSSIKCHEARSLWAPETRSECGIDAMRQQFPPASSDSVPLRRFLSGGVPPFVCAYPILWNQGTTPAIHRDHFH